MDAFVAKLDPTLSTLKYSTYLGTIGTDEGASIAVNAQGEAYVTGYTARSDFPTTPNAYRKTNSSGVFVTQFNATATALLYSTYLGTGGGQGIAVDASGDAIVTGGTADTAFPTTTTAYQSQLAGPYGANDAFVSKIDPSISGTLSLIYSTYLGGAVDECNARCGVAVDSHGAIYVAGPTNSGGLYSPLFPTTPGAYSQSCKGACVGTGYDAFVSKIDPSQSGAASLVYSTYLGSSGGDCETGCSIAVDGNGNAYVTGDTYSINSDFPTTIGAFQRQSPNYSFRDSFVAKIDPTKWQTASLVYGTYLAGNYDECIADPCAIAVDANGAAYVTGQTASTSFPTTPNAFQPNFHGTTYSSPYDAYVTQLKPDGSGLEYSTYLGGSNDDRGYGIAVDANGIIYVAGSTQSNDFPNLGLLQPNYNGGGDGFVTKFLPTSLLNSMVRFCSCPTCCLLPDRDHAGGPIDTLSGNYTYEKLDETVPVLAGSLEFKHFYSADTTGLFTRTLGYGWTHSYDVRLVFPTDPGGVAGQVQLQTAGGSQLPFYDFGNGTYQPYSGVTAQMSRITATGSITTYVVTATNQTVYTFNASGLVTQTVNPAGNVITYTYYPTGSLQSAQSYGRFLNFAYDTQNRLTSVTDPINRSTQFGYNANGDLAVMTDTRSLAWTYQYSGTTHLLTKIIDPDNRTVEQTNYDSQGRAVQQYNGLNQLTTQLVFNSSGTTTVTDGLNRSSLDNYGSGTWLGGSDAAGQPLTRTYDANFKPRLLADQNGNRTQYTWSANGSDLQQAVDASGLTTTLGYDALNNLTQTVDTRGFTTTYSYSGTLLTRQTDPSTGSGLGSTTIYTYGQSNLLVAQQDALGRVTKYGYDSLGQRIAITDALHNNTAFKYDAVGRLITTTDPTGQLTVNAYDNADHLASVTANANPTHPQQNYQNVFNRITRYGYDGFGRQIAVTDTLGHITLNGYDGAGRLISTTTNYSSTVGQNYLNQYNLITQYGYDAVGNRILVTDTLNHVTKTDYDNLNRPVTVTTNYKDGVFDPSKPDEDIIRVTGYDPAGNPITQTDALGRVTRTYYDSLNRVVSTTVNLLASQAQNYQGQYNLITQYGYDAAGNQVLITDTLGHVTLNTYDALNRLSLTQDAGGNRTTYGYDGVGNRVVVTDPLTGTTRFAYDALNRVVTTTNALSGTTVTVYDALGNRVKSIDALNHTTVYTYDVANRLLAQASPIPGEVTNYQYDALGRTVVITDPLSHATRTFYDALGRVVSTTNALTGTTAYAYDALSRQTVITDANSHPALMAYDGLGRVVTTTDALGNQSVVGYDGLGNRLKVTDGLTHTTVYTYDVLNRLVAQADPLGNVLQYGYDPLGNRTVLTDANGIVTQYGYDTLNRLTVVTESVTTTTGLDPNAYNLVTTYGYDAVGNRTVMTNARNFTTTYTYDVLYRLAAMRDPLGKTTTYAYDAVGNRTVLTDANGHLTQYAYDAVNRPLVITYTNDAKTVQYTYDKAGNRTVMTDSLGTTTYAYDALNRLTSVDDPYNPPITYTYDAIGNRTNLIYPDGKVVTDTYDAANRLITVTDWSNQATGYLYDSANRLITVTLPNTVTTVYAYDNANRATQVIHKRSGNVLGQYNFILDGVGNRKIVTETLAQPSAPSITSTINYAYDPLYRVTGANYTGSLTYTFAYRYDPVGNRTAQTATITSTVATTYTYDAANRLSAVGGQSYAWDNNGNLTNDGSALYLYDSANRLISTTLGGISTQFNYNGDGARLRQVAAGTPTTYTQDLAAPLPVVLQLRSGATTTSYEFSNGTRPIGQFNANGSGTWGYLLPDALGSVHQIAALNGSLTLAKTYDPYGSVVKTNGSGTSIFGFSGEQTDASGLTYLRARYMQPKLGMFLSRDPFNGEAMQPESMNGFGYVEGNPVNAIDPTGQVQWQRPSSGYEKMVEWQYELIDRANIHLEFRYLSSRPDKATYERPDIIRPDGGDVYEIEPYGFLGSGIVQAAYEAEYYVHELNSDRARVSMRGDLPESEGNLPYDWREVVWQLGSSSKFPPMDLPSRYRVVSVRGELVPSDFIVPDGLTFHAESPRQGVIVWWYQLDPDYERLTDYGVRALFGERLANYIRRTFQPPQSPPPQPVPAFHESPEGSWLAALLLFGKACWDTLNSGGVPIWAYIP